MTGERFEFKTLSYKENVQRNKIDYYQWMSDEECIRQLDAKRNNFSLLLMNLASEGNTGNIIRSSNAFMAKEVIIYGHKHFNRVPCVGSEFYQHFRHVKFIEDLKDLANEYDLIIGLENRVGGKDLKNYQWDKNKNTLIVIGHEGLGIASEAIEICDEFLEIQQFGSVRSLNVSVASAIVMNDYCNKTGGIE